jgi:hypothetical protein
MSMADGGKPVSDNNDSQSEATAQAPSPRGRSYFDLTGETIEDTLNLASWDPADRLAEQFERIKREIESALTHETESRAAIRKDIFPLLQSRAEAPPNAGVHRVSLDDLRTIQSSLLFSGHVQAVDGASVVHQTLPITIVQTAVVMANYLGETGAWGHRIFQKDVRLQSRNSLDEALALLQGRAQQDEEGDGSISDMLRRGLMMHGELNVLASAATAPWRVGHGHPLPKELLTGTGMPELIELSVPLFRELLLNHQQFVYVPHGTKDHVLQTIGGALVPLEYAIVQDIRAYLGGVIEDGHYGQGRFRRAKVLLDAFRDDAERKIVAGVFRVSPHAPAQVFYAHADHAAEAALVAMADAVLVETRGFPMLLDVAGTLCRELFPPDAILRPAAAVYAKSSLSNGLIA